jgi:hypothetical protein
MKYIKLITNHISPPNAVIAGTERFLFISLFLLFFYRSPLIPFKQLPRKVFADRIRKMLKNAETFQQLRTRPHHHCRVRARKKSPRLPQVKRGGKDFPAKQKSLPLSKNLSRISFGARDALIVRKKEFFSAR